MQSLFLLGTVVGAALSDVGFTAALGVALAPLFLGPSGIDELTRALRRAMLLSTGCLLSGLLAQSYWLAATMSGAADPATVWAQLHPVLTLTHSGKILLLQGALALMLMVALVVTRQFGRAADGAMLALLLLFLAARSASGHAATLGDFSVRESMQFLHLLSTSVWAGSILAAGFVVLPRMVEGHCVATMLPFMQRLSRGVTVALTGILVSGLYNAYSGLGGTLGPLTSSPWGRLLLLKLTLVGVALALGWRNRRMIGAAPDLRPPHTGRLAGTVRLEAAVMLSILCISAWLANSEPAAGP